MPPFLLSVKSGGLLQQLRNLFGNRGSVDLETVDAASFGSASVGTDNFNVSDGAGGWKLSDNLEEAPNDVLRATYRIITLNTESALRSNVNGFPVLDLDTAVTMPSVSAGRLLAWDGSQNVYLDSQKALYNAITTSAANVDVGALVDCEKQHYTFFLDSAAAQAVAIPDGSALPAGTRITFKDSKGAAAANNRVITPVVGTIEVAASYTININREAVTLQTDGSADWKVISGYKE